MRVDQWVLESPVYQDYEPALHRRKSTSLPTEPTVTVMKADSHLQVHPSAVCVICVIRSSMQTLRARCRWVPHERMVVDALTKRRGNSITMLRQLRDGALSIVDEDQGLAMRKTFRETHKRNLRQHQQVERAQPVERHGLFGSTQS